MDQTHGARLHSSRLSRPRLLEDMCDDTRSETSMVVASALDLPPGTQSDEKMNWFSPTDESSRSEDYGQVKLLIRRQIEAAKGLRPSFARWLGITQTGSRSGCTCMHRGWLEANLLSVLRHCTTCMWSSTCMCVLRIFRSSVLYVVASQSGSRRFHFTEAGPDSSLAQGRPQSCSSTSMHPGAFSSTS